jgi:hypothetical protein
MKTRLLKLLLLCLFTTSQLSLAGDTIDESRLKARFLYQLINFTQWPTHAFKDKQSAYKIGVLGDDIVELYKTMKHEDIGGRSVIAKSFVFDEISSYQIIFVRASHISRLAEINEAAKGFPILIISENNLPGKSGGMINFFQKDKKLRFSIEIEKAKLVGIEFRSQLLRLATND